MRVNADSLLIRAAATSTSGTLNDLTTDLIMANNNNNLVYIIFLILMQPCSVRLLCGVGLELHHCLYPGIS